jgi:tRNA-modifying protein YgfZ
MPQHSTLVPAASAGYEAARRRAGFIDRTSRGRIVVSGADRATYLQGLLTNDIAALRAGQGCYAAYLTPQGRMIADMHVYELGDVILLTLAGEVKDAVLSKLDQFVFAEDVQLGDVTASFAQWAVVGPRAASSIAPLVGLAKSVLDELPEHGNTRAKWRGSPAIVTRTSDAGEAGFDIYVEAAQSEALRSALIDARVSPMVEQAAETVRIEAGIPAFGRDMDAETIPLEAGIENRAISFTKGCYVGQEVIVRVLHRGHGRVARKLVGLRLDGERVPAADAKVNSGDKEVGHVTSSTWSPALGCPLALAYVHRDFVEAGTKLTVDDAAAEVVLLPFRAAEPSASE